MPEVLVCQQHVLHVDLAVVVHVGVEQTGACQLRFSPEVLVEEQDVCHVDRRIAVQVAFFDFAAVDYCQGEG